MKLLMLSGDRLLASGKKGAFWNTLEALKEHFDRIDILTPNVGDSSISEPFPKVYIHPSPVGLLSQPHWIETKGSELVALHKHEVMTVHEFPPFYNGRGARRLYEKVKVPYALEIHHIVGFPVAASLTERIGNFMTNHYICRDAELAKKVRVVNTEVRAQLIRYGVEPKKIECVPSFYLNADILKPNTSIEKTYDVAFCARLVKNKGLDHLLRALKDVPRAKLVVIGDGPERDRMKKLSEKLGISGRVDFLGWLPTQEDVIRVIQSANIFVMNSSSEGGPRVALEAMSVGMPILATPVGIMPDVIENKVNGMFTTGKPHELTEKIQMLLTDNAFREKLGMNAALILPRFERSKTIKEYADFLKSLV